MKKQPKQTMMQLFASPARVVVSLAIIFMLGVGAYSVATGAYLGLIGSWFYLFPLLVVATVIEAVALVRKGKDRAASLPSAYSGWKKGVRVLEIAILLLLTIMLLGVVVQNLLPR